MASIDRKYEISVTKSVHLNYARDWAIELRDKIKEWYDDTEFIASDLQLIEDYIRHAIKVLEILL